MPRRKEYATGAIILAILEAAWLIASLFAQMQGWISGLQRRAGAGATVIAFVTNPVFFLLLGCAAVYLAVRAWKAKPEILSQTTGQAPTQANTQTQSVNIYNQAVPVAAEKPRPAIRAPVVEPKPNLTFLGSKTSEIYATEQAHMGFFSQKGPGDKCLGVLVGFRNETVTGLLVSDAEGVRAHVLYFGVGRSELGSVLGACWLEEQADMVDFEAGKSLWLVVALIPDNRVIAPYYKRTRSPYGTGDIVTLQIEEVDGGRLKEVEVRVIDGPRELARVRLEYSTDATGRPILSTPATT